MSNAGATPSTAERIQAHDGTALFLKDKQKSDSGKGGAISELSEDWPLNPMQSEYGKGGSPFQDSPLRFFQAPKRLVGAGMMVTTPTVPTFSQNDGLNWQMCMDYVDDSLDCTSGRIHGSPRRRRAMPVFTR